MTSPLTFSVHISYLRSIYSQNSPDRHSLIEVCTFFADIVVTLQVSELYKKTAFSLVLKIFILILAAMHRSVLLQTKLSIGKGAFFLLAIVP